MISSLVLLTIGEVFLVLLLVVLIVFLTNRPKSISPKNVRDDVKKIKEQVMLED